VTASWRGLCAGSQQQNNPMARIAHPFPTSNVPRSVPPTKAADGTQLNQQNGPAPVAEQTSAEPVQPDPNVPIQRAPLPDIAPPTTQVAPTSSPLPPSPVRTGNNGQVQFAGSYSIDDYQPPTATPVGTPTNG
jgi:hypothetical protein